MNFEFATAGRIVFGAGRSAELPALVRGFGSRLLLVTGRSARGADGLEPVLHVRVEGEPTFDLVRGLADAAREARCDVVVAIGGGSVLDAGKALAMLLTNAGDPLDYAEVIGAGRAVAQPSAPLIAVPTTAGTGSEVTRNAVLGAPERGVKVSLRSPLMLPRVALVDPALALELPPALTAATGMDALAQLIEPFVSCRANPLVDALCRDGIPRVARALPRAFEDGRDLAARSDMALAALYSGMALANAGLGAVHGFAAAIGGMFPAPHGAVCAALLPAVFRANAATAGSFSPSRKARKDEDDGGSDLAHLASLREQQLRGRFDEVARLVTGDPLATAEEGACWMEALCRRLGIPGLAAYGVTEASIPEVVARARQASSMKGNPVELADDALAAILRASC